MKIKCKKCGVYFKDRSDPQDSICEQTLCSSCKYIWKFIGMTLKAVSPNIKKMNRQVSIDIRDIKIKKLKKYV
jgi:hypothetical protein